MLPMHISCIQSLTIIFIKLRVPTIPTTYSHISLRCPAAYTRLRITEVRMAFGIDGKNETKVGWVWNICNRSTFDVLWSCLSVILVCTYKVVHLNLPSSREAEASWDQLLFWKKWLRKLKWMCFMALSPELLLSMALGDFLWSRQNEQRFAQIRANHNPSLSPSKLEANAIDCVKEEKVTSTERPKSNSLPFLYAQRIPSSGLIWEFADLC